ncbi:hypothetical protein [Effusibacillus dendaii]|uniref:Uncharacterized protein n=1 Tax=Effusibacillus dendaii TaxID=2743772 RepID=A0A7I8DBH7_9BACL|nr:hypothetical protein [Effusibacillus dendaii]BCJ86319.1 hypothetical protein skT53_13040 [Effusibacillus dendaii]
MQAEDAVQWATNAGLLAEIQNTVGTNRADVQKYAEAIKALVDKGLPTVAPKQDQAPDNQAATSAEPQQAADASKAQDNQNASTTETKQAPDSHVTQGTQSLSSTTLAPNATIDTTNNLFEYPYVW